MQKLLFVAKCNDRREPGGAYCRIDAECKTDDGAETESEENRPDGYCRVERGDGRRKAPRKTEANDHPENSADLAEHDGLDDELGQDVPGAGTDGLPHADLAGPFRHR